MARKQKTVAVTYDNPDNACLHGIKKSRNKRKRKAKNIKLKSDVGSLEYDGKTFDTNSNQKRDLNSSSRGKQELVLQKKRPICETTSDVVSRNISSSIHRKTRKSDVEFNVRGKNLVFRSKLLIKPWPCRFLTSATVCRTGVSAKPKRRKISCQKIVNERENGHHCFDFANGNVVQPCCLSKDGVFWISTDPALQRNSRSKRRQNMSRKEEKSSAPAQSSASTSHEEIPGFYFDPQRNSYFRIVPGSKNCMPNAVTKERIESEEKERLRQQELKNLEAFGRLCDPRHQTTIKRISNMLSVNESLRYGDVTQRLGERQIRRALVANIRAHFPIKYEYLSGFSIKKILVNTTQDKLLVYYTDGTSSGLTFVNMEQFREMKNAKDHVTDSDLTDSDNVIAYYSRGDIVDFSWGCDSSDPAADWVVYCTKNTFSLRVFHVAHVSFLEQYRSSPVVLEEFINHLPICCSAGLDQFAVGTESNVYLSCSPGRRSFVSLNTSNAAVHSLAFGNLTRKLLFCGSRKKKILLFDQLSALRKPVAYFAQDSPACDLYLTKDDRYLISAEFDGKIQRWDLRQGRVVVEYPGHVNQYYRTPIVVDEREEFQCVVGADSYARIWDVATGELMKVLPPPLPICQDSIPSVCFSNLSSESKCPALILAMSNKLHVYPF